VLGAFTYTQNPALLHTDATVLPRRPAVRASWNYELSGCEPDGAAPRISYHMNRLQNLAGREDYIVTLGGPVDPGRVIDRMSTRIRPTRRPRSRRSAACPG
jgi:predicted NAD/FAD-binding protein